MTKKSVYTELKDLNSYETLAYVAYYHPKTHNDAIRFIYGKEPKHVSQKTIINARSRLLEKNYLKISKYPSKGTPYKSDPAPIVEYISNYLESRLGHEAISKESGKLSTEQEEALHMILDSQWFRGFFTDAMPIFMKGFYRDKYVENKITIQVGHPYEATYTVFSNVIGLICNTAESFHSWGYPQPTITNLIDSNNFDYLTKEWTGKYLKSDDEFQMKANKFKDLNFDHWGKDDEHLTFLNLLFRDYHLYCIPHEISKHVRKVGRRGGGSFAYHARGYAKAIEFD